MSGTKSLTPRLRFPEFRGAGPWEEKRLGNVCDILNNRRQPITGSDRIKGDYPYYGASGIVDYVNDYIFDERLLLVGEDGAKWGAFEKTAFLVDGKYWVNNHAHVLRPTGVHDTLLENYLTMIDIGPFITGAAPPKLTLGMLRNIPIPIPTTDNEQQKIADCLASLDDLIGARGQRLAALERHKKGLMQQLFPAKNQTTPALRFPEFREAEPWERLPVSEKVELLSGYPFKGVDISENPTGIPLMRGINITEGKVRHSKDMDRFFHGSTEKLKKYILQTNDLVIGMDGSKVGKNSALISDTDSGSLLIQRVARLRAKTKASIQFLFQHINSPIFHSYVDQINTSGGIPHISAKQICDFEICFPKPPEQQKIADCLSSVDDLIRAEAQKIDALERHKKGLMQQLFPNSDEGAP